MRISDWSSDVCSSDLALPDLPDLLVNRITIFGRPMDFVAKRARHAEPDEPDVLACDLDHARASKLDVVQIAFGGTLKNLQRLHAVDLVKILPEADVLALNIHATVDRKSVV